MYISNSIISPGIRRFTQSLGIEVFNIGQPGFTRQPVDILLEEINILMPYRTRALCGVVYWLRTRLIIRPLVGRMYKVSFFGSMYMAVQFY